MLRHGDLALRRAIVRRNPGAVDFSLLGKEIQFGEIHGRRTPLYSLLGGDCSGD